MTGTVLCVGALSLDTIFRLDSLPAGPGKFLPAEAIEVAQGMATAQAATIVRLGGKARLWASCGDDPAGDRIVEQLTAAAVDLTVLRRVPGARSGFSSIFMDRAGERIIVPFYDAAIRSAPLTLPSFADVAMVSVDVRWPDAAAMALVAAHDKGIPRLLDLEQAPMDVLQRLAPLASHIIASEHGIAHFTGVAEPAQAVIALAAAHPGFIAATAGEKGCWWFDRAASKPRHIAARPVKAVDTLAAGDVFHGAFALRLTEGAELEDAMRFASVAAALKCTRFGGRLGAPTRAEVEAVL